MKTYEFRHTIGFEETNLVGNVYYVNYVRWQGRCREMFLRDHAPSVLVELQRGLALVTTHCSCDYYDELIAFDQITIRMTLREMTQSRLTLDFEYWKGDTLAAPQEPRSTASGWVVLGAGAARIATLVAPVAGFADPVAFAVLVAGQ